MKKSKKLTLLLAAAFLLLACSLPISTSTEEQPAAPVEEQPSETPRATFSMATATSTATLTPTLEIVTDSTQDITSSDIMWFYNQVDRSILRIDPANHSILSKVSMGGAPQQIAAGEGSVWVIEAIDEQHSNILKIDTTINQVIASIPITMGEARCLTTGGDSVWVGIARPYNPDSAPEGEEYVQPGGIVRIEPATNQVAEFIDTGAVVVDLFLEGETLYSLEQLNLSTYVNKIDLTTRIITTIPQSVASVDYVHDFASMSINANGIWTTPRDLTSHYIFRVNEEDGKIENAIEMGPDNTDIPVDIAASSSAVWVALINGTVGRVSPATDEVETIIQTGGTDLDSIFIEGGNVWASSIKEAVLYQIDPETNEVLAAISTGSEPIPTPTTTVTPTRDPNAPFTPCEGTYQSRLAVGMRAEVNDDPPVANRVRSEASREAQIVGYLQPGETMVILAGPACSDSWVWWNVRSESTGLTGWTAEGDASGYWLSPLP